MGRGQLLDRNRNGAWWERIGRMVGLILCASMRVVLHGNAHPPSHTRNAPTAHMHEHTHPSDPRVVPVTQEALGR